MRDSLLFWGLRSRSFPYLCKRLILNPQNDKIVEVCRYFCKNIKRKRATVSGLGCNRPYRIPISILSGYYTMTEPQRYSENYGFGADYLRVDY